MSRPPAALFFDLFGTLVFVDAGKLARVVVGGRETVMTIDGLDRLLADHAPPIEVAAFIDTLTRVSVDMVEEKRRSGREIASGQRFLRALAALDLAGDLEPLATELSERHMRGLAAAVTCPSDRVTLLGTLASCYRLGLVSNFDHAPTARALLARHGLAELLEVIVISEEAGVRKPTPAIFREACRELGVPRDRCLHVGDSYDADVCGATSAGLNAVWVDTSAARLGPALGKIADVSELPAWLDTTFGRKSPV